MTIKITIANPRNLLYRSPNSPKITKRLKRNKIAETCRHTQIHKYTSTRPEQIPMFFHLWTHFFLSHHLTRKQNTLCFLLSLKQQLTQIQIVIYLSLISKSKPSLVLMLYVALSRDFQAKSKLHLTDLYGLFIRL